MNKTDILAPRLNANEDELLVTEILTSVGTDVKVGDILFIVETTKASFDVESTADGTVNSIEVEQGKMVDVGAVLARIDVAGAAVGGDSAQLQTSTSVSENVKTTTKAKMRAQELNVDLAAVTPVDGRIGVAEVEAAAAIAGNRNTGDGNSAGEELSTQRAVVFGGGGHAATIADLIFANGWDVIGAVDAKMAKGTKVASGLEVIGSDTDLEEIYASGVHNAFIGVGGADSSETRKKIYDRLQEIGFVLPHLVHPSAHIGVDVKIGPATYVLPNAMVGPRCRIGANVVVNSSVTVAHDCKIEDHAHLAPGAILAGMVRVGAMSVVGMGSTVLFNCKIGRNCLIHNLSSVVSNIPDGKIVKP
ncbi:MAG: NeuD/PglB/VioB family sugar acetyltransferase [Stappiaceae bacterium]